LNLLLLGGVLEPLRDLDRDLDCDLELDLERDPDLE
jgi:hypothetical protein